MKSIKKISQIAILISVVVTLLGTIIKIKREFFSSQQPELKYKISGLPILDGDSLQICTNQRYKYIFKRIVNNNYVDNNSDIYINGYSITSSYYDSIRNNYNNDPDQIDTLTYYKIEIINIGDKTLTFNDIHKTNPLRILIKSRRLIGAFIDRTTPIYIGASIDTKTEGNIFIKFDHINKKDRITLKILSDENFGFSRMLNVFGSSDYFSPNIKPFDLETAEQFGTYEEQKELKPHRVLMGFMLLISFFCVIIIICIKYRCFLFKKQMK